MTPAAEQALEKWLNKHFAPTTAYQTMVDLKLIERQLESPETIGYNQRYSARRIARWAHETGVELPEAWAPLLENTPAGKPSERKLEARSFEPADWLALRSRLETSDVLEDRMLLLALLTGLRAGDVLRIREEALWHAVHSLAPLEVRAKGNKMRRLQLGRDESPLFQAADRLWTALGHTQPANRPLSEALLIKSRPDRQQHQHPYRAAYQRLLRRLKELGEELETDGRLHTHRLRRTAAVAALRGGVDLATVQQLLGHSSLVVTEKYLDEDRSEDVAIAMQKFHDQLGGKTR